MRVLDSREYDIHLSDDYSHIVPSVETVGAFDFLRYCKDYRNIWDKLVHIPVEIGIDNDYERYEYFERLNTSISEVVGTSPFHTEKIIKKNWKVVYKIDLGLYLTYYALTNIDFDESSLYYTIEKIFTGFYMSIMPNCSEWVLLWEKMFVDKSMDRYEDFIANFGSDFYAHIFLYKVLKDNWFKPISIKDNKIIEPWTEGNDNWNWKYTLTKHKKYSKFITELHNIKGCDCVWEYFNTYIQENPCLIIWYILFNEFIIWNHLTICRGEWLWYLEKEGEYPMIADTYIINKDLLWDFVYDNQNVQCISLVKQSYIDDYTKRIEEIPIVKELKEKLSKYKIDYKKNTTKENQTWKDEVLKELELVRLTTDIAVAQITIKNNKVENIKTDFQVRDISRIKEMRDFTSENWWAHIEHYYAGKRYIKWDRIKNIWGKKWKNDWNKDIA